MKVTDEQISELKSIHGELYKVVRRGNDYILRFPTIKEWKEARSKSTTFSASEKLVGTCLVFPSYKDLKEQEKEDYKLLEVIGLKLQGEVVSDDDGDEGKLVKLEDGTEVFRVCRRGAFYDFKYPTRPQWKRVSGLVGTNLQEALDVLIGSCLMNVSDAEYAEIVQKDVAFSELVGAPFLGLIVKDWADSEGKRI